MDLIEETNFNEGVTDKNNIYMRYCWYFSQYLYIYTYSTFHTCEPPTLIFGCSDQHARLVFYMPSGFIIQRRRNIPANQGISMTSASDESKEKTPQETNGQEIYERNAVSAPLSPLCFCKDKRVVLRC